MLGLLIAGATVFGLGSTINASTKNDEARRKNDIAREMIDDAQKVANEAERNCNNAMRNLARVKAKILGGNMKRFVKAYSKIGKVNFSESDEKMDLVCFNDAELSNIYTLCTNIEKSGINSVVSGTSGTLLAVGAADFVAGGAILGEVSVAGTAMAGSALLGAVAAPVFAISGLIKNSEASANLERANSNFDKAYAYEKQCETYKMMADGVTERCKLFTRTLNTIDSEWFERAVNEVENIVKSKKGFEYAWKKITNQRTYTREEMSTVSSAAALAKTIKIIIDTNLLDNSGNLTNESEIVLDAVQGRISSGEKPININELTDIEKQQRVRIEKLQKNRPKTNSVKIFFRRLSRIRERKGVVCVIGILLILLLALIIKFPLPSLIRYYSAEKMVEDKKYEEAIVAFKDLGEFLDSEEKLVQCYYNIGVNLYKKNNFIDAKSVFFKIDGYEDSESYIEKCDSNLYDKAKALYKTKKYKSAREAFFIIIDYKDSRSYIKKCENKVNRKEKYQQAMRLYKKGMYYSASSLFNSLGKYKNSKKMYSKCKKNMKKSR